MWVTVDHSDDDDFVVLFVSSAGTYSQFSYLNKIVNKYFKVFKYQIVWSILDNMERFQITQRVLYELNNKQFE